MMTNSYLEYFLTLLGWVISNGLWDILLSTGLFIVPLICKIAGIWLRVREEGEDEGNKGMLSLPRIENLLYGSFCVMVACCMPLMNISLDTLKYDLSRASSCGRWASKPPEDSGYGNIISSMNGQTAKIPVWWYLLHKLSKGVTQAAVVTIPCRPDLRQLRFEVQHSRINNPALAKELQDFTNDCYATAMYSWQFHDQGMTKDKAILRDIEWLGSRTLLKSAGYYNTMQSRMPRENFPWSESRDSGRPNTGQGGYPTCKEWWITADIGLQDRAINQTEKGLWLRMSAALKMLGHDTTDYKEGVVRRLVSPENLNISQNGRVYAGYGGNADFSLDNTVVRLLSTAGTSLGSLVAYPAFDALRQALPMVQAILLMAIYIIIPLLVAFSAYNSKTIITLSFVIFASSFLTFWWELARWLDSWLIEALYSSDTHTRWNVGGFQNTSDDMIMSLVTGAMFIVLPAFWMGALGWAGVSIGQVVGNAMSSGAKKAEETGGLAADTMKRSARL